MHGRLSVTRLRVNRLTLRRSLSRVALHPCISKAGAGERPAKGRTRPLLTFGVQIRSAAYGRRVSQTNVKPGPPKGGPNFGGLRFTTMVQHVNFEHVPP